MGLGDLPMCLVQASARRSSTSVDGLTRPVGGERERGTEAFAGDVENTSGQGFSTHPVGVGQNKAMEGSNCIREGV